MEQVDKGYWLRPKAAKRRSNREAKQSTNRRERRRVRQVMDSEPQYKMWNGYTW